jgi:hypothetical protein
MSWAAGLPDLVLEVIEAHGGLDRWRSVGRLSLRISTGGLLFTLKGQRTAIRDLEAYVMPKKRRTVFLGYPARGQRGVFDNGSVHIESDAGEVIAARPDARSAFGTLRRRLWWDKLDMLYFCGYALWTYLSLPFLAAEPGFEVNELGSWSEDGEPWRRMGIRFPADVHTHCREQILYFDKAGLLGRHDYTAEPVGARARAAHYCSEHRSFDGLIIPTRRRVYPRRANGRPLRALTLVWIDIEDVRVGTA